MGIMVNNPVKVNPLGQIADSVMEQVKDAGSTVVKDMATEPAKILEQILGGAPAQGDPLSGETAAEQGAQTAAAAQMQQKLIAEKQQKAQQKASAEYKLHQQRLQEEIQYHEKRKQEKEQEKIAEEHEEDQKKQVVQLQKEQEDDAVWQQQLKAVQGSHEGQQGKM
jgi:hypothetical protein